ncbi:MAG: LuxR C-terminal-related transcriptional regulator, partial [Verrucomicrobiota bacterium]|nr:LuxR C-terminal-related transcriptional regulator [Verrucomicrobiota bacterium]
QQEELREIKRKLSLLTPREFEVFTLVVSGLLNKQIAWELGTAEKTIKVHRARVMTKMQVLSLAELVRMAERLGIKPRDPQ